MPITRMSFFSALAAVLVSASAARAEAPYVWWEAETPAKTNFPKTSSFSKEKLAQPDVLSGGDWLSSDGPLTGPARFASYQLTVPADGEYHLWARKFWQHGPFFWHFDDQPDQLCGRDVALADSTEIQKFISANWVSLGTVKLAKGPHTFTITLAAKPGESTTAAFDCFVLAAGPFLPNGKLKPGEKSGLADPGFFAWEPSLDPFTADAALDLRSLNEKVAGEKGFVKRTDDKFTLASGTPVRFWAVNISYANTGQSHQSIDYLARRLAKLGVNMVRIHGAPIDTSVTPATIDPKKLDDLQYTVAAMKKQGIYTTLSFYFPLWFDGEKTFGISGYHGLRNKYPFALLTFDPQVQAIYRGWARTILTGRNPHGLPLGQEPAVAIVEVQNEDSFFFWTFSEANVPPEKWQLLEKQFGAWLEKTYGSIPKATANWGNITHKHDDPAARRMGIFAAWDMTADGVRNQPAKQRRMADQVRFLAQTQHDFYASTAEYFHKELKVGGLVEASNWQVADPRTLDAIERWTYTAGDVIDRHGYFGGKHQGPTAGYAVSVGDKFEDRAPVLFPDAMPFHADQIEGFPQIVSEVGYPQPNRFRADATTITAAYGALEGIDGLYFFACGSNYVRDTGMTKFQVADPAIAGTFPATALLYRRGDVSEAPAVVTEHLKLEDLLALHGSAGTAPQALDALRQRDLPAGATGGGAATRADFDPLAFVAGRALRVFNGKSGLVQADLSRSIDRQARIVTSVTGQLTWDYGNGLLKINTPRTQGAAGFLAKAGAVACDQVTITSQNEYGSVLLTSLDDQPLATSKRMLLQVMSESQPYGFKTSDGTIVSLGRQPLGVRQLAGTVRLKMAGTLSVQPLDENGYLRGKPATGDTITLAPDVMYYLITR